MTIARRTLLLVPPVLLIAGQGEAAPGNAPGGALRWEGGYLFLPVRVNGRPAEALLDFGARKTLVDRAHAAALGVAPDGKVAIEAAGLRLAPFAASMSDLTDFANFRLRGKIAMVLGRELFDTAPLLLDLARLSLTPLPRPGKRRGRALPVSNRFGLDSVPVTIDGAKAEATLSLREIDTLRVSAAFAARAGLTGSGRAVGGASGMVRRAGVTAHRLEIAGRTLTDLPAALEGSPHAADAYLGPAILRHFRIGLDFPARTMWFDPI